MTKRFVIPFASTGDKSVTPDATDPAGAISYSQGWGSQYQLPDTDPSYRPVGRQELNGVLNDITGAIAELQTQGFPSWVPVAGLVPPYVINAMVRHADAVWRSEIANNSAEPGTAGSNWRLLDDHSVVRLTSNGTFTVPAGVTTLHVSGAAGGGGGGGGGGAGGGVGGGGAGGGAGRCIIREAFAVTPGQVISVTIGGAGVGGTISGVGGSGNAGTAGGNTVIGPLTTLTGGTGGGGGVTAASGVGGGGGTGFPTGTDGSDASNGIASANGGPGASSPYGGGGGAGRGGTAPGGAAGKLAYGFGGGGGGGGGAYTNGAGSGGQGGGGAAGLVIFEW